MGVAIQTAGKTLESIYNPTSSTVQVIVVYNQKPGISFFYPNIIHTQLN